MLELLEKYRYLFLLFLVATAALCITRYLFLPIFKRIAKKTKGKFDDMLVAHKAVERFTHVVPAIILYTGLPHALSHSPELLQLLMIFNNIYLVIISYFVYDAILRAVADTILLNSKKQGIPIQGVRQAALLVGFLISAILIVSQLVGKSPIILLSGLGALAAVFMLVFKDSILGFVAGIQIAALDLVRTGDWIEIPKEGINGSVEAVSLTHIRVRNWDNTNSVFPTYALVSTTYKNWRLMRDSGRRRIQRTILIDGRTLGHLSKDKQTAILNDPEVKKICSEKDLFDSKRPVNIQAFRRYASKYLSSLDNADSQMTLFARELPSNGQGIPLEVYLFSKITDWARYETFASDIVDHLMGMLSIFGLRVYQKD